MQPRGSTSDFKWRGWSKDFLGVSNFRCREFLGRKIWQVFFWWLDLSRDFWGYSKQCEGSWSFTLVSRPRSSVNKVSAGDFLGVNFWSRDIFGFCWHVQIHYFRTRLCRRCTTTKWKCLIWRFVENVKTRQRLHFSFPELWYRLLKLNSTNICQHLTNWTRWNKRDKVWSSANSIFWSDVFVAVAVVVALAPYCDQLLPMIVC